MFGDKFKKAKEAAKAAAQGAGDIAGSTIDKAKEMGEAEVINTFRNALPTDQITLAVETVTGKLPQTDITTQDLFDVLPELFEKFQDMRENNPVLDTALNLLTSYLQRRYPMATSAAALITMSQQEGNQSLADMLLEMNDVDIIMLKFTLFLLEIIPNPLSDAAAIANTGLDIMELFEFLGDFAPLLKL